MRNKKGQFVKGHRGYLSTKSYSLRSINNENNPNYGMKNKHHSQKSKALMSDKRKGKKPNNALDIWRKNGGIVKTTFKKGHKISIEQIERMREKRKGIYPFKEKFIGPKHPNWKGGVTPENERIRHSTETKLWRLAVFERDNFTCLDCGKHGVYLIAHHIKSFANHPELRFDVNNGKTLCLECHKKTNNYKGRNKGGDM